MGSAAALHPRADAAAATPAYRSVQNAMTAMRRFYDWFTGIGLRRVGTASFEAALLRCFGFAYLVLFVLDALTAPPHGGFDGRRAIIVVAAIGIAVRSVWVLCARCLPAWRQILALVAVTASAAALAALQPHGPWEAGPYFVATVAAMRLDRIPGVLMLGFAIAVFTLVAAAQGHGAAAVSASLGAIPWFLLIRLIRELRDQRDALDASRAAEARAAAAAERGRLAREMHDVLAHSLSALALQLESTRLLARDRGVDDDVTRAIDQAHHLAAGGLEEARRAIATARGDELPGPERLGALATAFGEQSGLPVEVEVRGEPRALAPEARLAVYRTAQEALTNVRRHATAERVELKLDYQPDSTVLVIADHAHASSPPPAGLGLSGGGYGLAGMRERAELLGGELQAAPTANGFRVELRLPAMR
jgi:signal transduction histidine kinase